MAFRLNRHTIFGPGKVAQSLEIRYNESRLYLQFAYIVWEFGSFEKLGDVGFTCVIDPKYTAKHRDKWKLKSEKVINVSNRETLKKYV